jgi:hypothetical protein
VAVVNHHGGYGGGHYTAFTNHDVSQHGGVGAPSLRDAAKLGRWFTFDDARVVEMDPEAGATGRGVVTSAAYVLVYQRRSWQARAAVGLAGVAPARAPVAPAPLPAKRA